MSATNRQSRPRDIFDFNSTPRSLCSAIVTRLPIDRYARILEPSAGDGPFVRALRAGRPAAHIEAIEVQPQFRDQLRSSGADRVWQVDYLAWRNRDPAGLGVECTQEERPLFDWVVGNPPYSRPTGRHSPTTGRPIMQECVSEHVRRSMALLRPGGHLAFLLRLSWTVPSGDRGSRDKLLTEFPIQRILALKERPSFRGGKTDATEYACLVWEKGWRGDTVFERMGGGPWRDE